MGNGRWETGNGKRLLHIHPPASANHICFPYREDAEASGVVKSMCIPFFPPDESGVNLMRGLKTSGLRHPFSFYRDGDVPPTDPTSDLRNPFSIFHFPYIGKLSPTLILPSPKILSIVLATSAKVFLIPRLTPPFIDLE